MLYAMCILYIVYVCILTMCIFIIYNAYGLWVMGYGLMSFFSLGVKRNRAPFISNLESS